MRFLHELIEEQVRAEATFEEFLGSLDRRRTVTLRELLENPEFTKKLRAPWLNVPLFKQRLDAMCSFYGRLVPHPRLAERTKRRLVFLQSSPEDEDRHEANAKAAIFAEGRVRRGMSSDVPVQAFYLHTNPIWNQGRGMWGNVRITPLTGFSNFSALPLFREAPCGEYYANVIGWRMTRWPKWLCVSNDVATDYFARIVIHDIGHELLPEIHPNVDSLHNVVMLHAVKAQRLPRYRNVWEEIVHRECTDPYFIVDGHEILRQCDPAKLKPLPRYLYSRFKKWYDSEAHTASNEQLWGIKSSWCVETKRAQVNTVIGEMRTNGFLRYQEKSPKP